MKFGDSVRSVRGLLMLVVVLASGLRSKDAYAPYIVVREKFAARGLVEELLDIYFSYSIIC